jgi:hypothetical protein
METLAGAPVRIEDTRRTTTSGSPGYTAIPGWIGLVTSKSFIARWKFGDQAIEQFGHSAMAQTRYEANELHVVSLPSCQVA